MFADFPDDISDYHNPVRLPTLKSILRHNPINNRFDELNLINLKLPSVKIRPLFIFEESPKIKISESVQYCDKPKFMDKGIPCQGLKEFHLKDFDINEKKKVDKSIIPVIDDVHDLCMPKFLTTRPKLFKNKIDENFAFQVNLNVTTKSYKELIPDPAWEWPFELDPFQQEAIIGLEKGKSVFVAAHTSAGKTVVAEYAIAMCHNRGARVIYTSPIKALSNQKYREFKKTFGTDNVGLLTGDIKTGANKYILVMTTEILHNMLKNDCTTLKDLDCVIMDEVHYLNDENRGHIWEQIMILLPKRIQLVMLSATVPNTMPFAEWLGRIRNTQIQVITTLKRPVPLDIYIFTGTGRTQQSQLFKIMDSNKTFLSRGYQLAEEAKKNNTEKAMKKFQAKPANPNSNQQNTYSKQHKPCKFQNPDLRKPTGNYNASNRDQTQWLTILGDLKEKDNLPVICFLFSRKRIQDTVADLHSLDFLDAEDKRNVLRYFNEILNRKITNPADKKLPQILEMKELLLRGLGMHHAGLLPLLKEIVEILFSEGFVKVLFATETFAVGVNMPARSVVFDSLEKHDGSRKRFLLPGEFTQMAGRAGRRGLDTIGNVIVLVKPQAPLYSQDDLKRTMIGSACQLQSKFKISYNMILSLYRNRQFNIQHMIRHSFIEAGRLKNYEEDTKAFATGKKNLESVHLRGLGCQDKECHVDVVLDYYRACIEYRQLKKSVTDLLESKNEINTFLSVGRVVLLDSSALPEFPYQKRQFIPAVVLALNRQMSGMEKYKVKVLTYDVLDETAENVDKVKTNVIKDPNLVPIRPLVDDILFKKINEVVPMVLFVTLGDIYKVCNFKSKIDAQDIDKYWMTRFFRNSSWHDWMNKSALFKTAMNVICEGLSSKTDPANYDRELNIRDSNQRQLLMRYFSYDVEGSPLLNMECVRCISLAEHLTYIDLMDKLMSRVQELEKDLSDDNLAFLPEYQNKVHLLKKLEFLNKHRDIIKLKGRIACEIESYEVVITELILSGAFTNAIPSHIAASLSCLMFESKTKNEDDFKLQETSPALQVILETLFSIVKDFNKSQEDCGIIGGEIETNCALVEAVRMWTCGATFSDVVDLTEVQYGDIIRCLQRIAELMRHCEAASKVMGDFSMVELFQKTQKLIYRGIVSTTSLYVDDI